jgi:hypothetical protein
MKTKNKIKLVMNSQIETQQANIHKYKIADIYKYEKSYLKMFRCKTRCEKFEQIILYLIQLIASTQL